MAFETNLFTPVLGGLVPVSGTTSDDSKNADVGIYKNPAGDPFQAVTWIDGSTVSVVNFGRDTTLDVLVAATNEVASDALLDSEPKIAVTPDGQIYVTYVRDNDTTASGDEQIVVRKYDQGTLDTSFGIDGTLIVAEVDGSTDGGNVAAPDIAAFDSGNFAVVWSEEVGADFDIYLRHYDSTGGELSTDAAPDPVTVAADDGINEIDPAIAARPGAVSETEVALVVIWSAADDDPAVDPALPEDNVGLKRFSGANTPVELGGGELDISGFQGDSSVDIDVNGNTVISYTQGEVSIGSIATADGSIVYQLSNTNGLPITAGTVADGVNSSVAMAPTGEFFIAFDDGENSFYQEFGMDGDRVRGIQAAGVGTNPSAAVTRNLDGKAQDFAAIAFEGNSVASQLLAQDLTGADFNMDGTVAAPDRQADIVWRNRELGENSVWTINPVNLQREDNLRLRSESNRDWEIVGVGDWTGGGINDDLLWRNDQTGLLSVWAQNGIVFEESVLLEAQETNRQWKVRAVGDMDGDGKRDDIVWQNIGSNVPNAGQISIWLMEDAELVANKVVQNKVETNTNWELTGAGEFGEGVRDELVFHNIGPDDRNRGQISTWFLNFDPVSQDFSFGSSQLFSRGDNDVGGEGNVGTADNPAWRMTGVADFDGNGTGDFLWRNFQTGGNTVWFSKEDNPLELDFIGATNTEANANWVSIA